MGRSDHALVVNVDVAVARDDEYLLIERPATKTHAAGLLAFPGGKLEPPPDGDETVEAAAARELAEEVGLDAGTVEYVCSSTFVDDAGTPCLNVVTLCPDATGEVRPRRDEEVAAVHWLSAAALRAREDVPEYLHGYIERVEAVRDGD